MFLGAELLFAVKSLGVLGRSDLGAHFRLYGTASRNHSFYTSSTRRINSKFRSSLVQILGSLFPGKPEETSPESRRKTIMNFK